MITTVTYVTRSLTTGLTLTMRTHTLGVEPSQSQRTPQEEAVVDAYLGVRVGVLHDPSGQGQLNDLDNGQKIFDKKNTQETKSLLFVQWKNNNRKRK